MEKTVRNGKVSLWTESFGSSGQPALLLIAGAMAPASFWPDTFCSSLAGKGFFVIRFDNRDFGRSTHFEPCRPNSGTHCPYAITDMVEDCVAILDAYGIERAHVAGHSLGGSIVQLMSVNAPGRLLSGVVISSPILATGCPGLKEPDPDIQAKTWEVFMKNPMYPDPERGVPEFLNVWRYLNGSLPLDEEMARSYTEKIYETETIEPAWNHTAIQESVPDIFPDIGASDVPLLFIHGAEDPLVQNADNIRVLARELECVTSRIIKGAGHVFFNRPVWSELEHEIHRHLVSTKENGDV